MTRTTAPTTTTVDSTVVAPWDVASWAFGPPSTYRLNASYRLHGGAMVTATGSFDAAAAVAALRAVLRPFEQLGCAVVLDVCHATLGPAAVAAVIEAGVPSAGGVRRFSMTIAHADHDIRKRVILAGGRSLLRPMTAGTGHAGGQLGA